jgi:uncharacterized protein (DUF362 family)
LPKKEVVIMEKSVVSIVKGTDAGKMVEEALSLLGGVTSLIRPGSTVIVKPNAGHPFPPETSVNTSPAVVTAVIKELSKAQPKEIILAEASAVGCDTLESLKVSGIGKAAEDAGADRIIDIKREKDLIKIPIRDARSDITNILLPRFLIEAEHIVNVPILKTHINMVISNALKNMKGVVQDQVHFQMHQTNLAAAMMDLWHVIKADLTIADLIRPAEGFGPEGGLPADFDCIVAGKDPVAIDATCCRMIGLDVDRVPYFEAAHERGIGNFLEENIEIRGRTIKEVFRQLWIPYLGGFDQWPEYHIYSEGACSSCQCLLAYNMEKLKALGQYEKNAGISVVIGRKKELPKGVNPKDLILIGNCTKKHRDKGIFVGGCPPGECFPGWSIIDRKGITLADDAGGSDAVRKRMAEDKEVFIGHILRLREEYYNKVREQAKTETSGKPKPEKR